MNVKVHLTAIGLLLIGVFLLTACVGPISTQIPGDEKPKDTPILIDPTDVSTVESPTPTKAELSAIVTIWHAWREVEIETLNAVVATFKVANPTVEFDILFIPPDDLFDFYQKMVPAGGGPTVLIGPAEWGPQLFDAGLIVDLSNSITENTLASIQEVALGSVQYRDALIGLPQSMSGVVLFRNKGIIPEAAATYEDMVVAANAATSGEVSGANLEYGSLFAAPNLISVCGGEWMDAEGEPAFNTDAGVCWIEIFKQWRLDFDQVANYSDADVDQFKAGRLGYLIESSLRINALAEAIGADQLVIDPWPKYSDGQLSGYVITDNIYLSVNASGEDKAASLAFIEFLLSPEAQIILADPTRAAHLPVNKDVLVDEPLLTQALIALEQGVSLSGFPEMHAYWPPLNDALLRAVLEDADPAEVLEEAYNRVTDDLVKMRSE